ncbi:MAG TPA: hypothetical protein VHL79_00630 [Ramlibacter sp.]|nr:hypothetical protein [Ramlibacter sp.]
MDNDTDDAWSLRGFASVSPERRMTLAHRGWETMLVDRQTGKLVHQGRTMPGGPDADRADSPAAARRPVVSEERAT